MVGFCTTLGYRLYVLEMKKMQKESNFLCDSLLALNSWIHLDLTDHLNCVRPIDLSLTAKMKNESGKLVLEIYSVLLNSVQIYFNQILCLFS